MYAVTFCYGSLEPGVWFPPHIGRKMEQSWLVMGGRPSPIIWSSSSSNISLQLTDLMVQVPYKGEVQCNSIIMMHDKLLMCGQGASVSGMNLLNQLMWCDMIWATLAILLSFYTIFSIETGKCSCLSHSSSPPLCLPFPSTLSASPTVDYF